MEGKQGTQLKGIVLSIRKVPTRIGAVVVINVPVGHVDPRLEGTWNALPDELQTGGGIE